MSCLYKVVSNIPVQKPSTCKKTRANLQRNKIVKLKYKHVFIRNNQDYACFVCFIVFNDSPPLVCQTKMVTLVETQYKIVYSRTCTLWQVNDPCELVILKKIGNKCRPAAFIIYCVRLSLNSSRPGQYGRHFSDDIFRCIFVNEKFGISIKIWQKFVPNGPTDNNPELV